MELKKRIQSDTKQENTFSCSLLSVKYNVSFQINSCLTLAVEEDR